ncbi:MAG: carboxylating nicotinate-nucleotide diphosphorylase [Euryarchaeota archaeon]|nr:carboxylating nicotinate-nucleotide diphosphorylase [Euryarchaeota archaeon]
MRWIENYLDEDVGDGDITTLSLIGNERGTARIKINEDGVVAGLEEVVDLFQYLGLEVVPLVADGDAAPAGTNILSIEGPLRSILTGERLALNIMMRMSGIATLTREIITTCRVQNPDVRVAATRKTTPGFRLFEKKAVVIGGGDPHRSRLDDSVLIKDNHLKVVGSITEAVRRAQKVSFTKKVEVEVESIDGAEEAAMAGADIILLDNMDYKEAARCAEVIRRIDPRIIVEASGDITPTNAPEYAEAVDVISLGWITHSIKAISFSLDVLEIRN